RTELPCLLELAPRPFRVSLNAPISRSYAADPRPWSRAAGPHLHRHPFLVRCADALRSFRRVPAAHHQEAAPAVDHYRIAVVPARGYQRPLAERAQGEHLGRVGR